MIERKASGVRLEKETLERIERLASVLSGLASGAKVSQSEVVRLALERGLTALEAEHGLKKGRKK